ncbi:hypothetical protein BLNAU_11974 [Blattamonas nauphoetae]|uniref:Uncharacterized protein n=1 Tax=Blattamonas nauphoetae TaxID=2049346 RepID=A0ABQ9XNA8_9EUKA|nr:hypothetical protein BLNAU_11974 [Blattamonas nauphoetae]
MSLFAKGSAKSTNTPATQAPSTLEAIQGLEQQKNNLEASIANRQRKIDLLAKQAQELNKAGNKAGAIIKMKEKGMHAKAIEKENQALMALTGQVIQMESVKQTAALFEVQMIAAQAANAEIGKVNLDQVEIVMDNYQESMEKVDDINAIMVETFTQDMMDDDEALAELEELGNMDLQHQLDQQQLPSQQYAVPAQQPVLGQNKAQTNEIAELALAF